MTGAKLEQHNSGLCPLLASRVRLLLYKGLAWVQGVWHLAVACDASLKAEAAFRHRVLSRTPASFVASTCLRQLYAVKYYSHWISNY